MNLGRVCAAVLRLEPWLTLGLLPLVLLGSPVRPLALLALLVPWLCAFVVERRFFPRTPLDWPVLILAGLTLVSLGLASSLAYAVLPAIGIVYGIAVYYALARSGRSAGAAWNLTVAFALLGGGVALLGLLGTDWRCFKVAVLCDMIDRLPALSPSGFGFQINPNALGGVLAFFVPLQIAVVGHLLDEVRRGQAGRAAQMRLAVQAALLLVTGAAFILAQARAAWLGVACGVAVYLVWRNRRALIALALVVVVGAAGVLAVGPQNLIDRVFMRPGQVQESILLRQGLWAEAVDALQVVPLLGFGLRDFSVSRPEQVPAQFAAWPDVYYGHAHNQLFQAALSLGLPGLAAYLAMWVGAAAMLYAAQRPGRPPLQRALAVGLLAALLAHFIFGLADSIVFNPKVGIVIWLTFGLVAAVCRVPPVEAAPAPAEE